ncbi:MAG: FAD-binding oxidoreductase [Verrucomicrobiae bacterium]|nr:FAD-binding oxidoreductase [Verrucomicrobiae bacterium]
MTVDTLIVGQGLAGSLLAWELLERGQRVLVVDRDEALTSSKVAAGIVTPITGKRLAPTWRGDEFWRYATAAYRRVETKCGQWLFRPVPIARLLASEDEARRWEKKKAEAESERGPGRLPAGAVPLEISEAVFHAERGGFEMPAAGWLDVPAFLEATRLHLLERLGYAIGTVNADDIDVVAGGVRWKNIKASHVIFCQGWEGNRNRFFDWVPFRSAKGQILDLECPAAMTETRIVNRAGWLLPLGGRKFRAGATYEWDFADGEATETTREGRAEVEKKLRGMLRVPFEITGQRAAVRPVIRESRALIGLHPATELENRVGFFNGLGSKGVLNGPFFAAQLADHLVRGTPLEPEVDLRKNL